MSETTKLFVLRNIHGGSMKYVAHFTSGILTHVTHNKKTLARGKDLYAGRDYAFAADVYGKSATVDKKARDEVTKLRRQIRRTDKTFTGLQQKRPGGRPSPRARVKDVGRQTRQKRYEAIIRRIKGIRDCSRKEAQKVYKQYLPTICANYPAETNTPNIVKISRAISNPDAPVTWVYIDEQSPPVYFGYEEEDEVDPKHYSYLRAVFPVKVCYGDIILHLPPPEYLESLWRVSETYSGLSLINTDFMVFVGVAADEDETLTRPY